MAGPGRPRALTHGLPRWPHDRFRERLLPVPESPGPRLRALQDCAARLGRAIEEVLAGPEPEPEPPAPRILVVEDDQASRVALVALFARRGWAVSFAGTVAEGLAMLRPPPDCVLLDLMLPDGGGEAILAAARAGGLTTRVVVTTGLEDPDRLDAVARLGPDSMLPKPVALEALWRACGDPS